MDLLFSRYASPFLIVNQMIQYNRFSEFIDEILLIEEDRKLWEVYLHKVFDKSYFDFEKAVKKPKVIHKPINFEATINDSISILEGFKPEGE